MHTNQEKFDKLAIEPKHIELTSDHDAVEALDAVRSDSVPRVVERDGEAIAAIITIGDLHKVLSAEPSDDAIARALAAAGAWREIGGDEVATNVERWRHASPASAPVEL